MNQNGSLLFIPFKVSIDGRDIRGLNLKSLRSKIGVVSQEPILFGISIKENILLGQPNARYEEVERAAKESNCHDFIMALPQVCLYNLYFYNLYQSCIVNIFFTDTYLMRFHYKF
jgi:ABC-type multidrug transport system fused ATPase/permease subunit